ncbi:protein RETARDED ROOT GROWTH-LIKE-like [Apium graveolens]|uniref:protein RETARDED ROOT GROWTH-LIKE-like n=1 Tax=Apium graveolens TaxID=4045 RepID=UPI003D79428D
MGAIRPLHHRANSILTISTLPSPSTFTLISSFHSNHSSLILRHSTRSRLTPSLIKCNSSLEFKHQEKASVQQDLITPSIPVRAFFFSTSVDLKGLVEQNKANFIPPASRMTNYVVLRFGNLKTELNGLYSSLHGDECCFMVVFQYGSVVLFNVRDQEIDGYLKLVKRHASGLLPETRKDEYEVKEEPNLVTWMQGGLDYIMLQYLNIDGIRTIGSVLGQSIALDYYVRQVDGIVAEFTDINRGMEKTGTFTMERKKLFQLVGKANSNLADVILKLGLFERSDIAWKDAKYAQIWEYLRDEFELTQRFASLDFKLKFVEHNIRFLQEILQNRKADFLEWVIIILIGAEILISVYDITHKSLVLPL